MKLKSKAVLVFSLVFFALSMAACGNEGGAEKAGKKIDNAFNTAKEKINDVTK